MSRRRGLTANDKKSAVLRCKDIEAAMHSLLMDVLNHKAYCGDMDKLLSLLRSMQNLRYRFESYPELQEEPHFERD